MISLTDKLHEFVMVLEPKVAPFEVLFDKSATDKIELAEVFVSPYPFFYQKNFPAESNQEIQKANTYLKSSFRLPLLYQPISVSFVMDYCFWSDMAEVIKHKKSVCLIRSGVNVCEALLYYFTQINRMLEVSYEIYPLFTDQKPSDSVFHKYANLLQSKFEGEKINYRNTLKSDSICTLDVCRGLADEWGSNRFDLLIFEKRFIHETDSNLSHSYDIAMIYLALQTLQKGGTFIFRLLNSHTKPVLRQLLSILSNHFASVRAHFTKIRANMIRIVCDGFVGAGSISPEVSASLLELIDLINRTDPPHILPGSDTIQSFWSEDSLIDVSLLTSLYEHIQSYKTKMTRAHDKYLSDMNLMKADDLITIHKLNRDSTIHKSLSFAKKYKLKLTDAFVSKERTIPSRLGRLEVFEAPIRIDLINMEQREINSEISIEELDLDLTNLLRVREKLNLYKIGIDSRNPDKWDKVTHHLNMSQGIIDLIKRNQSINISRGFVKMYEILHTYDLIRSASSSLQTLHICEAPGHFINATQYYARQFYPEMKHRWYASSLNPAHSSNPNAFGDNYGFIKNYPSNWLWGPDGSGDLSRVSTIDYFNQTFEGQMDLVTSDCGFGASSRYEYHEQESIMGKINLAQIIVALVTLKIGGHAVFKMYIPFTTAISISVVYILMGFFADVSVFKPITGSPTNNEIYLVCLSKKTVLTPKSYRNLTKAVENFNNGLYLSPYIDGSFIDQLAWVSELVTKVQIDNLRVIYYVYDEGLPERKKLDKIKAEYYAKWIRYFAARDIEPRFLLTFVDKKLKIQQSD